MIACYMRLFVRMCLSAGLCGVRERVEGWMREEGWKSEVSEGFKQQWWELQPGGRRQHGRELPPVRRNTDQELAPSFW